MNTKLKKILTGLAISGGALIVVVGLTKKNQPSSGGSEETPAPSGEPPAISNEFANLVDSIFAGRFNFGEIHRVTITNIEVQSALSTRYYDSAGLEKQSPVEGGITISFYNTLSTTIRISGYTNLYTTMAYHDPSKRMVISNLPGYGWNVAKY